MTKGWQKDCLCYHCLFLVISSAVEKSLAFSGDMGRDYHFWVYIVTNRNESVLCIGVTNSLARRTDEHRRGAGSNFAAAYRCTKLIYHEHYSHITDALARETQLKKWSRAKKVALIATESHLGRFGERRALGWLKPRRLEVSRPRST